MDSFAHQQDPHGTPAGKFESDAQRIVHRHLQDKDHIITDEEFRSVRVGLTPPAAGLPNGNTTGDQATQLTQIDPAI